MFTTLRDAFADKHLRKKIFMTLLVLLVFRLGCYVPVPGIDVSQVSAALAENDIMQVMSTITGGALSQGTLFSLGIVPFINSFIIMQLLTLIFPQLEELSRQGDEGMKKRTQYTRLLAILLAIIQGVGVVISMKSAIVATFGSVLVTQILIILMLIGGSMICMWLGERITEYGIGNGTSLLIFVGILSSAGTSLINAFKSIGDDVNNIWYILGFLVIVIAVFFLITFVDMSERRIPVKYSQRVKGNKMYGGQSTYIPIKVNASGVMPIIFASSFLMFPQMIASFWPTSSFYLWYSKWLGVQSWVYCIVLPILILFFAFFYSMIQFDVDTIAGNIQSNGGQIPNISQKNTKQFLKKVNGRITLFGALYLSFIALIPSLGFQAIGSSTGLANAFTATGMLIVVSVALELDAQLQSQLMLKHSRGFLK